MYGLLVYHENNANWRNGDNYIPTKVNIGDYIQSLAAKQFLPSVNALINREEVKSYNGTPVKMIMNGWWRIFDGNEYCSNKINPLYISYHIACPEEVTNTILEHLKKYAPIGCRDMATCRFLSSNGVNAYFSGCLTLTLGKTYKVSPEERGDEVILADVDWIFDRKFDSTLRDLICSIKGIFSKKAKYHQHKHSQTIKNVVEPFLQNTKNLDIVKLTHSLPIRSESDERRFEIAEQYLKRYARAKFVITSRIHSALPCLALGTPVLLVFQKWDSSRYEKLLDLMNYIGINDNEIVYQFDAKSSCSSGIKRMCFFNRDDYSVYANRLTETVANFIQK